jgi:hypothetical protein
MRLLQSIIQVRKKYIVILFLMVGVSAVAAARVQLQKPSIPKGLLTRLIEIKYTSELYLTSALKKGASKDASKSEGKDVGSREDEKDSALAIYNTLRWKVDGLVYQLSGDLVAANSPRKMRLLNQWCLEQPDELVSLAAKSTKVSTSITSNAKPSIQTYTQALTEIDNFYQKQIASTIYVPTRTVNLSTNVFYLLKDSYTIINGLSDMKTQKTMAIIELLDHTRLLSPAEIAKQGK